MEVTHKKSIQQNMPGTLRNSMEITIQTRQAQLLIDGRNEHKNQVIGIKRFLSCLNNISIAIRLDDPYADWWLNQLFQSLGDARKKLACMVNEARQWIPHHPSAQINISESISPTNISISFSMPLAYAAAQLLVEYDEYIRITYTLRNVGAINCNTANALRYESGNAIRKIFNHANKWTYFGATRKDFIDTNKLAEAARSYLGEIPEEYLIGQSSYSSEQVPENPKFDHQRARELLTQRYQSRVAKVFGIPSGSKNLQQETHHNLEGVS